MKVISELDLGIRSAEREKHVIQALQLYTYNTGYHYFHSNIAAWISDGKSAWGYLPYPQDTEHAHNDIIRNRDIRKAFNDLKYWGLFEVSPQAFYRDGYPDSYRLKHERIKDIQFGLLASKRTYRVLTEISKVKLIKDYKLFGRTLLNKYNKHLDFQGSRWKCKIRHMSCYVELNDLVEYGLITSTDGSEGYRLFNITEQGRDFMRDNKQYLNENYKL